MAPVVVLGDGGLVDVDRRGHRSGRGLERILETPIRGKLPYVTKMHTALPRVLMTDEPDCCSIECDRQGSLTPSCFVTRWKNPSNQFTLNAAATAEGQEYRLP